MRRRLCWLILVLAALASPVFGSEAARLISPADGSETLDGSLPCLDLSIRRFSCRAPAFPTRDARLLPRFGAGPAPEPRPALDGAPAPRARSVSVRLLIRRFNE